MPNYRIQYRRDTAENWQSVNPILLDGEVGYEITDQEGVLLQKVGDGIMGADGTITGTHWNDLPYVSGPIGPAPEHEWQETSLRFRNPNGTWGDYTNLQGPQGIQGIQGEQGEPGLSEPATKSSLGGIIVGSEFNITEEGCLSPATMLINTREFITVSGVWEAPVTGWYKLTIIGGGDGCKGSIDTYRTIYGGRSGFIAEIIVYMEKGSVHNVTVGAGGTGTTKYSEWSSANNGGLTSFDDITAASLGVEKARYAGVGNGIISHYGTKFAQGYGGGLGGGIATYDQNGNYYGAGGGGQIEIDASGNITASIAGNGKQGCVIAEYYDPEKAADASSD